MKRIALIPALLLVLTACGQLTAAHVATAEAEAKDYAKRNFPDGKIVNVKCKAIDSDADGYARCELTVKLENGDSVTPNIECAYGAMLSWADGCQQPKAVSN
jgi:hypothetical protein